MASSRRSTNDPWGGPTRWTLIREAAGRGGADLQEAWNVLIQRYREPVRRSVRRLMANHAEADQVAEDFFAYLFEKEVLPKADPDAGRFRCFMQGVVRNYVRSVLRQRRRSAHAGDNLEQLLEGADPDAGELEREEQADWARAVLQNALEALVRRSPRDGVLLVKAYGIPPHSAASREDLCAEHDLSMGALNVALHRARAELRRLLVAEIRSTVATEEDLEDERRMIYEHLLSAWPGLVDPGDGR